MFSNIKYQSGVDNIFNIDAIIEVNWRFLKNNRKHVNGLIESFIHNKIKPDEVSNPI